jgi:micrococcal nuclease
LETGQGVIKVRLAEIDASEIDQPYGTEARDVLCRRVCGRDVDIEPRGNSYDRVVGLIRVGGIDTSEAMVRAGAAWDYPQYDTDPLIPALQARARAGHIGLWAAARPVAPWDWRHRGAGRFRSP